MYAKIQKEFNFMAAVHFNGKYMVNFYEMNAVMSITSLEAEDQNIAVERINYFISQCLEDCIFVSDKEKDAIDKYTKAGMKVCTIPEEPYDQIVGLVILNKCNSIMEGRITMTDIVFGSKLSNMIKFELNNEVAEAQFDGKNWWDSPTMCIQNIKKNKKEKIVNLFDHKVDDWAELELTWTSK